jgi:TetR/AcrR family transcriptional repressor of nem operon
MARTKEFDRDTVLDRAVQLFWRRGYDATSVQDLVDELGLNRSSLYSTWPDKATLFAAVIERYGEQVSAHINAALAPPSAGRAAVESYLAAVIASVTERGCLLLNTTIGCTSAPAALLERANDAVLSAEHSVLAALRRDPALRGRRDLKAVARALAAQAHGLAVMARAGARPRDLEDAARVSLRLLDA